MEAIIAKSLRDGAGRMGGADALVSFLRSEPSVILFDGLDEIGTRLGTSRTSKIYRQLLEIIPDSAWEADLKKGRADWAACPTRILVTCRTHFFRDNFEEDGVFNLQHRAPTHSASEGVVRPQRFYMAPFSVAQIEHFVRSRLGAAAAAQALDTLRNVHDLIGLASKPLLARLVIDRLPEIVDDTLREGTVNAARVYNYLFRTVFARDHDKRLMLSDDDRAQILENLALRMWRQGRLTLPVSDLESWLDRVAAGQPGLKIAMTSSTDARLLVHKELENAALLVREGDDRFRFAVTSFFEYFLARAIIRALMEGSDLEAPQAASLTAETIVFINEIASLATAEDKASIDRGIERVLNRNGTKEARQLLADILLKKRPGKAVLSLPKKADLSGLQLADCRFDRSDGVVYCGGWNFSEANLRRTEFFGIRFDGCMFSGAAMDQSYFTDCHFAKTVGGPRGLFSTRFQSCSFSSECDPLNAACAVITGGPEEAGAVLKLSDGHNASLSGAVFSADDARVLTASSDNTARIWDARTGEEIAVLKGHGGSVLSAVFSADDARVLTASSDNTARIWDARTGEEIA
ncbi:MAG: pentapeptide repeat-containing protein, partial [Alphaproteobacteria bacterium]|nr:pentapeptide repeat-containing protein [Alphaproteobacteria bacterium]